MVVVASANGLCSYIPMLYANSENQGLQVCRLLKDIDSSCVYTVVTLTDRNRNLPLPHVMDYSWAEDLVD